MRFSRMGDKLAVVGLNNLLDVYDFDRCTGLLSNFQELSSPQSVDYIDGFYGCSFSESGRFLYVSSFRQLFQYDLENEFPAINRDTIFTIPSDSFWLGGHQIALNNQIYIANAFFIGPSSIKDSLNENLDVITYPDNLGPSCEFKPYSFYLNGNRTVAGLPNLPNYELGALEGSLCDTLTGIIDPNDSEDKGQWMELFPNPANQFVTVELVKRIPTNASVEIRLRDLMGIVRQTNTAANGITWLKINLSSLNSGLYLVEFDINGMRAQGNKLLVTH